MLECIVTLLWEISSKLFFITHKTSLIQMVLKTLNKQKQNNVPLRVTGVKYL